MGFFNIPDKKTLKPARVEKPAKTAPAPVDTEQTDWARGLLDALVLCTGEECKHDLHCINLKHLPSGKYQAEATDRHIFLRVLLDSEHISALSALTGQAWNIDSEAFWLPADVARKQHMEEGWDMSASDWPDTDSVIPAQFKNGPASMSLRPWFAFDILQRVEKIYRALGIPDSSYRHYWFNGLKDATADRRTLDAWPGAGEVEMLLMVMPVINIELYPDGYKEGA
jgi:hypothetical protein